MHLLTSDEWKVLSYTMRRIFGFHKEGHQDRISLTQYQTGTVSKETGAQLDHGTGLSRKTVVAVLAALCRFKLIECVAPNDPRFDEGALYRLQIDSAKVDIAALEERARTVRQTNESRVAAARQKSLENRRQRGFAQKYDSVPTMAWVGIGSIQHSVSATEFLCKAVGMRSTLSDWHKLPVPPNRGAPP
jgi:hypothetical protein